MPTSDQNCNFRKFKMADGRHFENSFISVSQPWIIRFRSNLVHLYKFPFWGWKFDIKSKFFKFKMADRRHIENRFWLYIGAIFSDLCKFRNGDEESRADIGQFTKMAIFTNSRWRTDAIIGNRFWLYIGAILSDQREIWNRDEWSHADVLAVTKTAIFANSRWWMAAILKIDFSQYLSRELSDFDQIWYTYKNFHPEHETLT